jgi:hypothetical protein
VTKFDNFVQDVLQKYEETAGEQGLDIEGEGLEKMALQEAKSIFDKHYAKPLLALPNPPKAVVFLSASKGTI